MKNNIIDYIQVFEKIVPDLLCDKIINEYEKTDEWKKGTVGDYNLNSELRNCDSIFISKSEVIDNNPEKRKQIDDEIFDIVSKCLQEYLKLNSLYGSNIQSDSGYSLLRYKKNQCIGQHIDSSVRNSRELSCSINLNDDYTGGKFCFFNKQKKYKLNKGDVIMFPSNFMYPHEILPIKSGTRYSIITWIS
jgi:predicted 2-oxoglutarate/Fe(II)-dependent dioxygenase YbiX